MHEMQKLNKDTRRQIHGISKTRRLRIVTILSRCFDCDNDKQRPQISHKKSQHFLWCSLVPVQSKKNTWSKVKESWKIIKKWRGHQIKHCSILKHVQNTNHATSGTTFSHFASSLEVVKFVFWPTTWRQKFKQQNEQNFAGNMTTKSNATVSWNKKTIPQLYS